MSRAAMEFEASTYACLPPCMPEVLGVVPAIRWQPERVALCVALFLRGAASWFLIGFSQALPVPHAGVSALR
jgi:hypothetical protein